MMLFTAILAAWVAGVAGSEFPDEGYYGEHFVTIHVPSEELLRMCVKAINSALQESFREEHFNLFPDFANSPPNTFLEEALKKTINPKDISTECQKFITGLQVPNANKAKFDKLIKELEISSRPTVAPYLLRAVPTYTEIAIANRAAYDRILPTKLSARWTKAALILGAARIASENGNLEAPLASKVVAMAEFLNGYSAYSVAALDKFPAEDDAHAIYTQKTCVDAVKDAVEEAIGVPIPIEIMADIDKRYSSIRESQDVVQEFAKKIFTNCFDVTNAAYDYQKFSQEQKQKIAELQVKLIPATHPNSDLWLRYPQETDINAKEVDFTKFIPHGISTKLMAARFAIQASRAAVGIKVVNGRMAGNNMVMRKLQAKLDFLGKPQKKKVSSEP